METAVAACVHWWVIEAPRPGMAELPARCRFCGAERTFPAEAPTWREEHEERVERRAVEEELWPVS
jgi:hypothetical protein